MAAFDTFKIWGASEANLTIRCCTLSRKTAGKRTDLLNRVRTPGMPAFDASAARRITVCLFQKDHAAGIHSQ